ncbi:MAG: alpha-D-glucose phosphate-specific phosphoglucomutase [Gammaproteobacteria bacterium]|nr:MAG: alpha-D-glucose phosphate-specific phosphoglucomutase [Gammaproteobacteria bacterium]
MSDPLQVSTIHCQPYRDQRPGTAGLRKKVEVFRQPHYLETFVEAILRTIAPPPGATLIVGGDGRYLNEHGIELITRMAAAHGIGKVVTGIGGLLSTPAASLLIRRQRAAGGLLLTASHNPGGPSGDFGIKFNTPSGGQAPASLSEAIFATACEIHDYRLASLPPLDLHRPGRQRFGSFTLEVIDGPAVYAELMESLFDFERMAAWLRDGHRLRFDALHAVTGPYAEEIFCRRLGAPRESLLHAEPLPDFGGFHPDPNPVDAAHLIALANDAAAPDLIAASDGDGDRNMILGPGMLVHPCDSVAVMLANAQQLPGYRDGFPGVARSMPTSRALDAVARELGLPCYETPTGWRYFCNLLDAGLIGLCGEESFGTGAAHTREKDGLWAVLFWLNLLAATGRSIPDIMRRHWQRFGRHYYQRHDYHVDDAGRAEALVAELRARLPALAGQDCAGSRVTLAEDFCYRDPVDGSESAQQGIRVFFADDSRIVYRLSGTGTSGATLRVYLERHEPAAGRHDAEAGEQLAAVAKRARLLGRIEHFTGLAEPSARI